jgi:hypothetical protein
MGHFLVHSALLHHEGSPITLGIRILLLGFCSVDAKEPFSGTPTGLSSYASWFSIPWMHRTIKDGYQLSHRRLAREAPKDTGTWNDKFYVRMLFVDVFRVLAAIGDVFGTHAVETLVEPRHQGIYLSLGQVGCRQSDHEKGRVVEGTTNHVGSRWNVGRGLEYTTGK